MQNDYRMNKGVIEILCAPAKGNKQNLLLGQYCTVKKEEDLKQIFAAGFCLDNSDWLQTF